MRVLIACEFSGTVRDAFTKRGHYAVSCDLLPSESEGMHYKGDIRDIMSSYPWDLMIAHPDCTYLCSSGLHWNNKTPGRAEKTELALAFVRTLLNAKIDKIALENPVGCISTRIYKQSQFIHPHEYGHDASKKTGLWLKGLPLLIPTNHINPRWVCDDKKCSIGGSKDKSFQVSPLKPKQSCPVCGNRGLPRWANQTDSGQNKLAPSADRWKLRALTYQGWADAMADQWGFNNA